MNHENTHLQPSAQPSSSSSKDDKGKTLDPDAGKEATPSNAAPSEGSTRANAANTANAAKLQAVASLQRLFFEEMKSCGDPNAAAAAALVRLAEESRPGTS